jgi:uncharacterized membrane protein
MNARPLWLLGPPLLAGLGLGGFFDGIVFHQILQWHHLVSSQEETNTLSGLETNTTADGIFHIIMWFVLGFSLVWLWGAGRRRQLPRAWMALGGLLLLGWGAFNIFDGVMLHLVLNLHDAREDNQELLWNLLWIAWGGLFAAIGWVMAFGPRLSVRSPELAPR